MRQIFKTLAFLAGLLPIAAAAQTQFPTLPANSVLGRTGVSAGAAQAIPFAQLQTFLFTNIQSGSAVLGSLLNTEIAAPATPALGKVYTWVDSTDFRFHDKNPSGTIGTTVVSSSAPANQFANGVSVAGVLSYAQPSFSNLSGTAAPTQGGTGLTTYALGNIIYGSAANTLAALAGNTTAAKQFLTQTGTGSVSAAPVWGAINVSDISDTAWTAYTPTITAGSGTFTTVSGSGRYKIFGKTLIIQVQIVVTTIGTASGDIIATLPGGVTGAASIAQSLSASPPETAGIYGLVASGATTIHLIVGASGIFATTYNCGGSIEIQ